MTRDWCALIVSSFNVATASAAICLFIAILLDLDAMLLTILPTVTFGVAFVISVTIFWPCFKKQPPFKPIPQQQQVSPTKQQVPPLELNRVASKYTTPPMSPHTQAKRADDVFEDSFPTRTPTPTSPLVDDHHQLP